VKHLEAADLLLGHVEGTLDARTDSKVENHAQSCRDCSDWLATYNDIERAFGAQDHHPSPESLADYALEPAGIDATLRASIKEHLERCRSCSREYRVTRDALRNASRDYAPERKWQRHATPGFRKPVLAMAAAAAMIVASVTMLPKYRSAETVISDLTVGGSQVIEASDLLVATSVDVPAATQLSLRADRKVVLGEGFSVKQGGRLTIATTEGQTQ